MRVLKDVETIFNEHYAAPLAEWHKKSEGLTAILVAQEKVAQKEEEYKKRIDRARDHINDWREKLNLPADLPVFSVESRGAKRKSQEINEDANEEEVIIGGEDDVVICQQCSTQSRSTAKFCYECGTKLRDQSLSKQHMLAASIVALPEKVQPSQTQVIEVLSEGESTEKETERQSKPREKKRRRFRWRDIEKERLREAIELYGDKGKFSGKHS